MKKLHERFTIATTSKIGILFKYADDEMEVDDVIIDDYIVIDDPTEWVFDAYDIMSRRETEQRILQAVCERDGINPDDVYSINAEYDINVEDAPRYVIDSIDKVDERDRRDLLTWLYNQMG